MEKIKLDLIPSGKMPSLHASQYDDGRDYHIDLTENRVPYTLDGTETISLTVRKCDNTLVTMDIANTFADKSYIEFRTTEQMNACAGFNYGEITIEKNGTQISSLNFYLQVEGAPDEGGITSQSEINNLKRQVHDIVVEELADNGAKDTGYDNTESGLEATNVQDAIDEVNTKIENIPSVDAYTKEETDEKFATKTALEEVSGDIPTKTSELNNDSGFATMQEVEQALPALAEPVVEALVPTVIGNDYYNKTQVDNIANAKANVNVETEIRIVEGERSFGETFISFAFEQGKRYFLTNTGSTNTFNAFLYKNGSSVQTVKYNVAIGEVVEFTANQDADSLRLYMNGAGSFKIEYNRPKINSVELQKMFQLRTTEETDANNIRTSGYYIITTSKTNLPESSGLLIVYLGSDNHYQTYQLFVSYATDTTYVRNEKGSGIWSTWNKLSTDWEEITTEETDCNNLVKSGFYFVTPSFSNRPINSSGVLIVYKRDKLPDFATYQMFIGYDTQQLYTRNKKNGVWSDWLNASMLFGNRNIAWFGDSITALRHLDTTVSILLSAKAHSFAIPGAPFDRNTAGNWQYEYLGFVKLMNCLANDDYTDVDLAVAKFLELDPNWKYAENMTEFKTLDWSAIDTVVVSYGTNDFYASLESIADFKTHITNAFVNLMQTNPHVQIYVFSSPYRTDGNTANTQGLVLTDYVSAIKEVCESLNIPFYDTYHNSGINTYTATTFLENDGLHPNALGNTLLSQKVAKFINNK